MTTQPEALRLADELEDMTCLWSPSVNRARVDIAAAELRRLHEENKLLHERHHDDNVEYTRVLAQRDALLEALKWLDRWMSDKTMPECRWKVRGTIEAVEGENHAKSL